MDGVNNTRGSTEKRIGHLEYQMKEFSQKEAGKGNGLENIKRNRKRFRG